MEHEEPEDHLEQTAEEIQAHVGPSGPVEIASRWLQLVLIDGDYAAAWRLTDPAYRAWRAREWVTANAQHPAIRARGPEQLVAALAEVDSASDGWPAFAATEIAQFRESWSNVDLETWGWASRPRPLALGYELVICTPDLVGQRIQETTLIRALQLVMHHTDSGWLFGGPQEASVLDLAAPS